MSFRQSRLVAASVALLLASSCGDDPAGPNLREPGIRIIAGGSADTVTARPIQALIIEARGEGGALAIGRVVRFSTISPPFSPSAPPPALVFVSALTSNFFNTFAADTADQEGRAAVLLGMGTVAGEAMLEVSVPETGIADTITVTIQPGAPARARFNVRDTVLLTDSSFALSAPLVDRFNNPRTELATLVNLTPTICSLTGAQVKGTVMGRCMVEAQHGEMRDTARASVLPFARFAVVANGQALRLVSTNGTGLKNLLAIVDQVLSPGWAPDGSALVIYEGDPTTSARLSVVDTNGVKLKTVGQNTDMNLASFGRFSPDGQWVYFTGRAASLDPFLIWRMKPDGSERTAVTTPDGGVPFRVDASPDGVTIAYDLGNQIILANVSTQQKTPTGVQGVAPSYSPDGQTIAYYGPGGSELRVMNANGTNVRTVLGGGFLEWQPPQWTSDGQWLLVSGPRFVNVADGTVITVPTLSGYHQIALKPPLGQ
ncbi:MAG: TolB family protein [Gemmatimonadaceae bacterium]